MDLNLFSLLTVFTGFVIGFLINFTGVGGGVLLVPVLTLVFQLEVSIAVGTASLFATLTKIYATYEHIKLKTINYKSSLYFLLGALPGVFIAAGLINYFLSQDLIPEEKKLIQVYLRKVVIVAIFISSILILLEKLSLFKKLKKKSKKSNENLLLVFLGVIIGIIMGATGIGGGVLIFPAFYLSTKLISKEIVGSSIFIALVISGATAILYSSGGQANYSMAILLVFGSLAGVFVAGKMMKNVSNRMLDYMIITIIFLSGVIMIFSK